MSEEILYDIEFGGNIAVEEFVGLLVRSTLGERRPIDQPRLIRAMLDNADVIATARSDGVLVGIARALSDFSFCTYLSDLAVDSAFQRRGIGKELIRHAHKAAGLGTTLILIAAPKARNYYPHIGLVPHDSCWTILPSVRDEQAS